MSRLLSHNTYPAFSQWRLAFKIYCFCSHTHTQWENRDIEKVCLRILRLPRICPWRNWASTFSSSADSCRLCLGGLNVQYNIHGSITGISVDNRNCCGWRELQRMIEITVRWANDRRCGIHLLTHLRTILRGRRGGRCQNRQHLKIFRMNSDLCKIFSFEFHLFLQNGQYSLNTSDFISDWILWISFQTYSGAS